MTGNGDGTFQPHSDFESGLAPTGVAVGDFNQDGKLDIAVVDYYISATVLLQTTAVLSPGGLSFPDQIVGTPSTPIVVSLTNTGTDTFSINRITTTGTNAIDFVQTNDCGSSLSPGTTCAINVVFAPTSLGFRNALLTVTDSASGSPQSVPLSGNGVTPTVLLSPTRLIFGVQAVHTTSGLLRVGLTNTGNAPLTITSVAVSGDFLQRNNCGHSVAAGASCTISVAFSPTTSGIRTGTITITDDALDGPQTINLTGTGTFFLLSPPSVDFGNVTVGITSQAQNVTLTNKSTTPRAISAIGIGGTNSNQFGQTNTCGTTVGPGASCTISVTFSPTSTGSKSGTLQVVGGGATETVTLSGTGS